MADYFEIKTDAAEDPVTLAEAKLWLKRGAMIADDAIITSLIKSATKQGEDYCNRSFVERTFTGYFDSLQQSAHEQHPFVELRRSPLLTLSSVKVMAAAVLVDVASETYQLKPKSSYSRLLFTSAPSADDTAYPLQVEFIAGYGAASTVPDDLKTAIKEHVSFLYENRGDALPDGGIGIPPQVREKYSKYRIVNTF